MSDYISQLIESYKSRGILIDTNILLLWCVGTVNRQRISKFNRTEKFLPEDYDTLLRILEYFSKIVTTPQILTEVNSLVNQVGEPERSQYLQLLAHQMTLPDEFYIASATIGKANNFTKFGLTDCGIVEVVRDKYLVLTDDFKLANYLAVTGIDTLNFNHVRPYGWR
jgi:rRNA-processing protein FCF1